MKHTQSVLRRFSEVNESSASISSITLAELEFGICNSTSYEKNRAKLISFLPLIEVLPFDNMAAVEYSIIRTDLLKRGIPIRPLDMLIAAQAKSRNLIIITNNVREFDRIADLQVEDWLAA